MTKMQAHFQLLADHLQLRLRPGEAFTSTFAGEDTDFARFNHAVLRQAGHVTQQALQIDLRLGRRHASGSVTLQGDLSADCARLDSVLADLRDLLPLLPEDPHLLVASEALSSDSVVPSDLPHPDATLARLNKAATGRDLVGLWASGSIERGFASSTGQRNWFARDSFNFDWSLYRGGDKAVKRNYAGFTWNEDEFEAHMASALHQLDLLARPARTIAPGRYRAYLPPTALNEIVSLLAWGGFGQRSMETKQTSLLRLIRGEATLHPAFDLAEATADGVAPDFQATGFRRPPRVPLIAAGRHVGRLISPRSAKEYGVPTNGAADAEEPESVEVGPGPLPVADVLSALGTGLLIGNLWYLNYSDRPACRFTGMTRFATFWVEGGEIREVVNVMRFDDTLYHVLGSGLEALTRERSLLLDTDTYGQRSTRSARLPGALVDGLSFTL